MTALGAELAGFGVATVTRPCARCGAGIEVDAECPIALVCDACAAADQARRDEARAARARAIAEAKPRRVLEAFLATVPKLYAAAAFDHPELAARVRPPEKLREAQMAAGAHRIVLRGGAGTGKTTLAVALCRARIAQTGENAAFVHAHKLSTARSKIKLGEGEAPIVELAMRVPLLLIDDLGTELATHNEALTEVIQERHAEDRATVITTGLTVAEVTARYGDGIARRVFERAKVLHMVAR
jgi:DNA replication protein DnaC